MTDYSVPLEAACEAWATQVGLDWSQFTTADKFDFKRNLLPVVVAAVDAYVESTKDPAE